MENELLTENYGEFVKQIKNMIREKQYEAMRAANKTLITLYWKIGEEIYNQQQEKGWGKSIVEVLSNEIKQEFPRRTRLFSKQFMENEKFLYYI